jgi:hypothetical protein
MGSKYSRLPSRFPVGTRHIIEGCAGQIHTQYLEFPDGRQIHLPADLARRTAQRRSNSLRQRVREKVFAG